MPTPAGRSALLDQALLHERQGHLDDARAAYDKLLRRDPRHAEALHRLALVESRRGDLGRATQLLRRSVAARPGADSLTNLGILLHRQGAYPDALAVLDKAVALDPRNTHTLSNRGLALLRLRRPAEALDSFDRALALDPAYPEATADRGLALRELGRHEDALDSFERALRLRPDLPIVRLAAGQCRLLLGDFQAGWQGYEHRPMPPPPLAVPRWTGVEDPAGKTVLVHAEQGFGDTIQFCRYAAPLAARGAEVIMQVQPPLVALLRTMAGPAAILPRDAPLPRRCDLQVPVMSLPLALGTTFATIPGNTPYLAADSARIGIWTARLGPRTRPRIGLAWSGNAGQANDHNRSMPFAALKPLLGTGADFVSLQWDVRTSDMPGLAASGVRHFGPELADFADTAALVELMDLVVSVDTSILHLAGALGRPAWAMLAWVADWRWGRDGDGTSWYPGMRLFRQPGLADWLGLVTQVRAELAAFLG